MRVAGQEYEVAMRSGYLTDEIVWETECGWQITVPGASDAPKLLLTEGDQEVCRVAPFGVPCKVPPKDEWLA